MTDRERLLREMNEAQVATLLAMADLEEEDGQSYRARGWRWLAERRRWPLEVGSRWEWWREKEDRPYACSLPRMAIDGVRKLAKTPKGETCSFDSASQALGCAATCIAHLIHMYGTTDLGDG